MADVKWIKITTDMFDNRKIKHLRKLPDGNNCVLIWVMLLTMAGRCNANGMIFLTETFPYSTKMLADELDFEENTVKMALATFELMGMIEKVGDFITIKGCNEYQNVDRLTEIREYNRLAQQKSRAKKKLLANVNDMSMTSQSCHETDIDKEVDKEKDKEEIKKSIPAKPKRTRRGEYNHVLLTDEEYQKLQKEYGNADELIRFLDEYKEMKGYKCKNDYLAIRKWVVDAVREKSEPRRVQASRQVVPLPSYFKSTTEPKEIDLSDFPEDD